MKTQSFCDFIERYGEEHSPAMRYDGRENPEQWQTRLRQQVSILSGPVPERVKMVVETVGSEQMPGHRRILLSIKVNRYEPLPAYLLIPDGIAPDERRPGIVALHGHTRFGFDTVVGCDNQETTEHPYRAYGRHAVESGFVVIVPCYWGWSVRDGHLPQVGGRDKCNVIQMAAGMYGLNILALHLQDAQTALDALMQRSEVDPVRIGCIGNSYGGRTAMWLSALDQRIRACVASGCANTFRERSLALSSCAVQYFPGILQYGDVHEIFGLTAPRALQIMCGAQDPLLTAKDRDAVYNAVSKVYENYGCPENLEYAIHPEGHRMYWPMAEKFLRRTLDISPSRDNKNICG